MPTMPPHIPPSQKSSAHESKGTPGTWAPIDTVPPEVKAEGTDVLVALLPGGRQVVAHWDLALAPPGWAVDGRPVTPTHWQPLGALPVVKEEKEKVTEKEKEKDD
jgi:hypothetical protein